MRLIRELEWDFGTECMHTRNVQCGWLENWVEILVKAVYTMSFTRWQTRLVNKLRWDFVKKYVHTTFPSKWLIIFFSYFKFLNGHQMFVIFKSNSGWNLIKNLSKVCSFITSVSKEINIQIKKKNVVLAIYIRTS